MNNEQSGHGSTDYANGFKYIGEYLAGQEHGYGTLTYPAGHRNISYTGKLANGRMVCGIMKYTNKTTYFGEERKALVSSSNMKNFLFVQVIGLRPRGITKSFVVTARAT